MSSSDAPRKRPASPTTATSSSSTSKHTKMAPDDAPYELLYWPTIPGRGEFARLLFEQAGVAYHDSGQTGTPVQGLQTVTSITSEDPGPANPPIFAVPALRHGDILINQTPNILQYIAPRLGLVPEDNPAATYHLNAITLTLMDGLVLEAHDTHHPIAISLYYEDQMPESRKRAANFIEDRLPKYMGYAQRVIESSVSGEGPWMYAGRLTYVDLVLFQCVDGVQYAFPKTMGAMRESGKYSGVFKLYDAVKELPNIKSYLASDRRQKYSIGIWRHYPELEEPLDSKGEGENKA